MTPTEILKKLKEKIDIAKNNNVNYVLETEDVEMINDLLEGDFDEFGKKMELKPRYSRCQQCRYKDELQESTPCYHCIKNNTTNYYYL